MNSFQNYAIQESSIKNRVNEQKEKQAEEIQRTKEKAATKISELHDAVYPLGAGLAQEGLTNLAKSGFKKLGMSGAEKFATDVSENGFHKGIRNLVRDKIRNPLEEAADKVNQQVTQRVNDAQEEIPRQAQEIHNEAEEELKSSLDNIPKGSSVEMQDATTFNTPAGPPDIDPNFPRVGNDASDPHGQNASSRAEEPNEPTVPENVPDKDAIQDAAKSAAKQDVEQAAESGGEDLIKKTTEEKLAGLTGDSLAGDENPLGDVVTLGLGLATLFSGVFAGRKQAPSAAPVQNMVNASVGFGINT